MTGQVLLVVAIVALFLSAPVVYWVRYFLVRTRSSGDQQTFAKWRRRLRKIEWIFQSKSITFENPTPANGVQSSVTLMIGGLVQAGALIAILKDEGPANGWVLLGYLCASIPILGGLVRILTVETWIARQAKPSHFFDRATIMFTRWALASTIGIVLVAATIGWIGKLPGQTRQQTKEVATRETIDYQFEQDHRAGLILPIKLDDIAFPDGLPKSLRLVVRLDPELRRHWEFTDIDVQVVQAGHPVELSQKLYSISYPDDEAPAIESTEVILRDLSDVPRGAYVAVRLFLHPKNEGASVEEARDLIEKKEGIVTTAYFKPE